MRALVTGASGFIGQVLCKQLGERGHEVTALVRRPGSEPAGTNAVLGDLRVEDGLAQALASWRPDCVFHLADRKSTRLNSSHSQISYAVFCLKKKKKKKHTRTKRDLEEESKT